MVESSKCSVTFSPTNVVGNVGNNLIGGITVTDTAGVSNDLEVQMEYDNGVYAMLDSNTVSLTNGFSAKKWFQGKQADALQAATTVDPTELTFYQIWVGSTAPAVDDPGPVRIMVTVTYNVIFTERKRFSKS